LLLVSPLILPFGLLSPRRPRRCLLTGPPLRLPEGLRFRGVRRQRPEGDVRSRAGTVPPWHLRRVSSMRRWSAPWARSLPLFILRVARFLLRLMIDNPYG